MNAVPIEDILNAIDRNLSRWINPICLYSDDEMIGRIRSLAQLLVGRREDMTDCQEERYEMLGHQFHDLREEANR